MSYGSLDFAAQSVSFGEIAVGALYEIRHNLTQQDVHSFSALTDDFNPVHIDRDFARQTSFGKPVVYGMLTAAFISTMIGMVIPGPGALWVSQTLHFFIQLLLLMKLR